jgi:hypothetical protein
VQNVLMDTRKSKKARGEKKRNMGRELEMFSAP